MFEDPVEDIIKILYDQLEAKIYTIVKSKKKIKQKDLRSYFLAYDNKEFDYSLESLRSEGFIKRFERKIPHDPKAPKLHREENKYYEIILNEDFDFELFYGKYKHLKQDIEDEFKLKEEQKYYCSNCKIYKNENEASRINYTCIKCNTKFEKNLDSEDNSKKKIKFKYIWDILDEKFKKKIEILNQENFSNNYYYIKSKYGNDMINNNANKKQTPVFEEDYDPFISDTLKDIEQKGKELEKFAFYEIIEAFNRIKKK